MLIFAAQKSDLIIHIYIYSFYITFHYGLSQDIVYSFLCYTVESCYLFILYIPFASASPKFPLHSSSIPSPLAVQFSSVAQSCLTLWDPIDCSTPGFPVHHQLPDLAQTQVHWVDDAIQLSHPLSSPSVPVFNLSQHQGLFKWISSSHQVAKVLEFHLQHQSFQWMFRTDFL